MRPTKGRLISRMRFELRMWRCLVEILAVDQRDELGIVEVVFPGEADEALDGGDRIVLLDLEPRFRRPEVAIGILEGDAEQLFLLPK